MNVGRGLEVGKGDGCLEKEGDGGFDGGDSVRRW